MQDSIVPDEADDCVMSGAFVVYEINHKKLDPHYLEYFFKVPEHWKEVGSKSSGTNVRRQSLHPTQFQDAEIPLPPLTEQQRIVARIEELATQINEARTLRHKALEEADAFIISNHLKLAGNRTRRLGEILSFDEETVPIRADGSYPQVGVKSFGGGLFPKFAISGAETGYRTFNRLFDGALVLSQVKGWEGAVAVCPKDLVGWFVSPEYRTFRCIHTEARSGYLGSIVRRKWFWSRLTDATRGVGARRERTRPEQFLNIEIPMPDAKIQEIGERVFEAVDVLMHLQEETVDQLDMLLPAILDRAFKEGLWG